MKKLNYLLPMFGIVFAVACLTVSVSAQSLEDKNQFASANSLGSSVRWDVKTAHATATLTVAGPDGEIFTSEFQSGSAPEFRLTNKKGERLPDGQYAYELRLTPVFAAGVKDALKAAREKGNEREVQRELRKRGELPAQQLVQSGGFLVVNGTIVVAGASEETPGRRAMNEQPTVQPAAKPAAAPAVSPARVNYTIRRHHPRFMVFDQVIPDDLIVQGSICTGLDCVNNENFGFDTIRLKENNLRIGFDDTSVGTFPSNNWEIRANDSTSGGANFLGIADMNTGNLVFAVDAGASANALRVSSTSNVGLGTATPVLDIHANTTDTPAIRLEQNNGGGFAAQTWDIGANEANFFIRDVTGGSRLSLRIRPGAPTSSVDIAANGNVGVGTASPRARVDIKQTEDSFVGGLHLRRTGALNDTWAIATGNDNNLYFGYANNASLADSAADFTVIPIIVTASNRVGIGTLTPDQRLSVGGDASKTTGGSWLTLSDRRLKNIKSPYTTGLKAVMALQPIRFEYRDDESLGLTSDRELVGFSAQEVQKVIPEAVRSNSNGYLMVNNDPIIWTMLNAIKEQQKEIAELKREIRKLRATNRRRK